MTALNRSLLEIVPVLWLEAYIGSQALTLISDLHYCFTPGPQLARFYRKMLCVSALFAVGRCPFVYSRRLYRPGVAPSF